MDTKKLKLGQLNQIALSDSANAKVNTLLYLPTNYNGNKKYPMLCFFHGSGEAGTDLNRQLNQGLPKVYQDHITKSDIAQTILDKFIMITIQAPVGGNYSPSPADNVRALSYLKSKGISIDESRIYATGLSAGGNTSGKAIIQYPELFAASIPMSAPEWLTGFSAYKDGGYSWYLSGDSDYRTKNCIRDVQEINKVAPGKGIMTVYPGGHCCWTTYYNPSWKWTKHMKDGDIGEPHGLSLYEWMLQYSKPNAKIPDVSQEKTQPRAIIAGGKSSGSGTIEIHDTTIVLDGSQTTGAVDSWNWGCFTKPEPAMAILDGGKKLEVSGMEKGKSYNFFLTVHPPTPFWNSSDSVVVKVVETQPVDPPTKPINPPDDPPVTIEKTITKVIIEFSDGTKEVI